MALDLSRFAHAFLEEALEHVAAMESLLIAINPNAPEEESLHGIFRAVHSIKGGAGAFGHAPLADFTHEFESILDRVRKGRIALTRSMVGIFLKAGDVMRAHVVALGHGGTPDLQAMDSMKAALGAVVQDAAAGAVSPVAESRAGRLRVELTLPTESFPDAGSVEALIEDLAGLGTLEALDQQDLQDERRVSFEIESQDGGAELRDSLEFLLPAEAIHIAALEAPCDPFPSATAELDDADGAFGFFAVDPAPLPPKAASTSSGHGPSTSSGQRQETDAMPGALSDADSIRVNVGKIDQLVNLVGEIVITHAMVAEAARAAGGDGELTAAIEQLARNTRALQENALSIRMLPISFVFSRLPRLTRDLAERLGKEVDLELQGEDTELDKGLIEKIADPLLHLVRNSLDHGIEPGDERTAKGKPRAGRLVVSARHEGGNIVISVADDGNGLNREKILAKALDLGMEVDPAWSDEQVWQLVLRPGFSTAQAVSEISGRGVGMDVVRRNVQALGGKLEIASIAGRGARFTIRLPLTLAIIEGMSVRADGESYIVPLACIAQSLHPAPGEVKTVGGHEVLGFKGDYVPVIGLAEVFGRAASERAASNVLVLVEVDGRRVALWVDELVGQHQAVVKGLEENYRKVPGVSGATILGDGRVAMILDAAHLVAFSSSRCAIAA